MLPTNHAINLNCGISLDPILSGETLFGLRESLTSATDCLTGVDSSVAVSSAGELFLRFISLTSLEHQVKCTRKVKVMLINTIAALRIFFTYSG